jgi:hypothetical protein
MAVRDCGVTMKIGVVDEGLVGGQAPIDDLRLSDPHVIAIRRRSDWAVQWGFVEIASSLRFSQ